MVAGGEGLGGMSRTVTLGLDVGGTKVAGGLVSDTGRLLLVREHSSLVDGARDPGLTVTLGLARELMAEAASEGWTVDGIGAGFPEYVDLAGRLTSHEVLSWTGQPAELLAELAPVTIESDVRCAALGEGAHGVARGLKGFVFVIVGTGLSFALVEDGRPRPGARGEAIALGELEVSRHVDATSMSRLERYASGEGIRERYEALTGRPAAGAAEVFAACVGRRPGCRRHRQLRGPGAGRGPRDAGAPARSGGGRHRGWCRHGPWRVARDRGLDLRGPTGVPPGDSAHPLGRARSRRRHHRRRHGAPSSARARGAGLTASRRVPGVAQAYRPSVCAVSTRARMLASGVS